MFAFKNTVWLVNEWVCIYSFFWKYCMSKKTWPILYRYYMLLYEMASWIQEQFYANTNVSLFIQWTKAFLVNKTKWSNKYATFVRSELQKYTKVIKERNIISMGLKNLQYRHKTVQSLYYRGIYCAHSGQIFCYKTYASMYRHKTVGFTGIQLRIWILMRLDFRIRIRPRDRFWIHIKLSRINGFMTVPFSVE